MKISINKIQGNSGTSGAETEMQRVPELDVQAESTYLNPAIKSKKKLIDWTLTMLGAPLVTVELNETQFDAIIADSIELYTKYAWFGERYILLNLCDYEDKKGFDTKPYRITSVHSISTMQDYMYGAGFADPYYGYNTLPNQNFGVGWGSVGGSLGGRRIVNTNGLGYNFIGGFTSMHVAHEFMSVARKLNGSRPDFQFDHENQRLILFPAPRGVTEKMRKTSWVLVTCECEPPLEDLYGNNYVKRIVLAKAKILLGTIRAKFQSVQLIGGGTIDTSIKDEGTQELQTIIENIRADEAKGQTWYIC